MTTRTNEFAQLSVAGVERLCEDAVAVSFDVPAEMATEFAFRPGQSLTLRRLVDGRDERRSYSICAPAGARPRIGVREVDGGQLSGWLVHELKVGDVIDVLPPAGRFTPDVTAEARHVLVAAGSGITPMISIAASVLAGNEASEVALVYGNRRSDTVMFADELADLKDRYPSRFQLLHVLSREQRESDVLSGRLDAARFGRLIDLLPPFEQVDHWWLCGPHPMVETVRAELRERGVEAERVHRELFYVEDTAPELAGHAESVATVETTAATVILDGRATTITVPRDVPLLDSAQRVRADLPFACKGGVCGTCRAKVISGEVRMRRNFALEDEELLEGFVLTCQALPVTDEVAVDYDA